jgi:hypothetical protein
MSNVLDRLMPVMMDDDVGMTNSPFVKLWWPPRLEGILVVTTLSSPFDNDVDCACRVINEEGNFIQRDANRCLRSHESPLILGWLIRRQQRYLNCMFIDMT